MIPHLNYYSHSFALRCEREYLQDVVVNELTLRCSQGHAVEVTLDERESHLFRPRDECNLVRTRCLVCDVRVCHVIE